MSELNKTELVTLAEKCYDERQYTNVIIYLKEVIRLKHPLNYFERSRAENVIYQATTEADNSSKIYIGSGECLDIFQKWFTNFFVLNLPLKYAYLKYALPVKYALSVLRNIYPKKSVFKMFFTA